MRYFSTAILLLTCTAHFLSPSGVQGQFTAEPPYIATEMELVDAMLQLAYVGSSDVLFDLGSGDGRIPIRAAQRFGTRGVGYEHKVPLVELSRARAARAGVDHRVRFHAEDLFQADLRSATVVTLYLGAVFNLRLRPRLLSQLRPNSRIVSNTFHLGDWRPDSTVHFGSGATRAMLHLWVVPARVDGFWSLAVEGAPLGYAVEFDQRFQHGSGVARAGRRAHSISGLHLRGDSIHFRFSLDAGQEPARFSGRVAGDRMEGHTQTPQGSRRWLAIRFTHPGLAPEE
ncbi:hypothetical protein BH23GEM6_BH23GEM6_00180 [soil metagenome]